MKLTSASIIVFSSNVDVAGGPTAPPAGGPRELAADSKHQHRLQEG